LIRISRTPKGGTEESREAKNSGLSRLDRWLETRDLEGLFRLFFSSFAAFCSIPRRAPGAQPIVMAFR
jgi:hypothetical protein